ncbi:glyoxalase superfamily protein [Bosea sp. BIWAKO-01]|uniref:glyoxalase superfamily protein n=1 Tax=Bosea sp. BIWAKO-01 TaxID=506668 RepID=UPI00085387E4|nr:glyoxalase superfamily protein [Bosea sp. BIWAKO-01]
MRTYRDAKLMAKALREAVAPQTPLSHAQALEIVARQFGYDDWNILAAKIGEAEASPAAGADQTGVILNMGIPILRIFDLEKAKEFYLGFLGFSMDWDHRYGPEFPIYMQISRSGLQLHLSEHHGDASPGSTVFVWMQGVDAYRAELIGKRYPFSKPGIQENGPGGRTLEVPDPFGNRIRFCQKRA